MSEDLYRKLPAVGALLESDGGRGLLERFPRPLVLGALRGALDEVRAAIEEAGDGEGEG